MISAHNGFEDLHVASAATKISCETVANIVFSWFGISVEQIDSSQNHPGSTDATLSAAVIYERLLYCVQFVIAGLTNVIVHSIAPELGYLHGQ